jgi:hypothetical protein
LSGELNSIRLDGMTLTVTSGRLPSKEWSVP